MTNPFLNRFNTIYRGSRVLIPFFSDLNTFYKKIVGTIFNEKINNLPARFLPRVAKFNGTDDEVLFTQETLLTTNSWSIDLLTLDAAGGVNDAQIGGSTGSFDFISISATTFRFRNSAGTIYDTVITFQKGLYNISYDGLGTLTVTMPDNTTFTDSVVGSLIINAVGHGYLPTFYTGKIGYFKLIKNNSVICEYYLTGQGSHEYDISGNGNHGTIEGTGTHYDFDLNGSTRPNDVGYSLWQKASNPDIQVPFDINGAALSLTAGVNITAGYSHERDVPAGGDKHNIYESLVGFNEDNVADSELEIFDRSNATRQTATSRASLWYDGTDLVTKSRYHITEIVDPNIYDTFFNTDYKNMVFGVVKLLGSVPILLKEFLNYANKKIGSALTKVTNYCGITNIYP